MKIISQILSSSFFEKEPPVLVDIGASGEINAKWKKIAPWSVCIAFDADDREFKVTEKVASGYKKLLVINRIVTATETPSTDFYLTASPYCSSLLEPDTEKLKPWIFQSMFQVQKKVKLEAITLKNALTQAGFNYIDWFKTDTQGTDLRLFKSLDEGLRYKVLAAEFEPGIIDAYKGEDKLFTLMQEFQDSDFWLSSMEVKGTQRLNEQYVKQLGAFNAKRMIRRSPGWAEVTYLRKACYHNPRQVLLQFIFALLEKQYGFALEICDYAEGSLSEKMFAECKKAVLAQLRKEKLGIPLVMLKKQLNKLFADVNA